jgi:hypothetical protein
MVQALFGGAGVVLGIALSGCGAQTVIRTVTLGRPTSPTPSAASEATSGGAGPQKASIGDTLTLAGSGGESMVVTVDHVMDPLSVGQFDQADGGQRYVGVQITLKNIGGVAYSDSPSNGATLLSGSGDQATPEIVSGGPCSTGFASSAKIAVTESEQGCVAFELPTNEQPAEFQFTLESGFANQTGEWTLSGPQSASGTTSNSGASSRSTASGATNGSSSPGSSSTQCDQNISAGPHTSCPFAENVFRSVAAGYQENGQIPTNITAKSPTTRTTYSLGCVVNAARNVVCSTSDGATATFSVHSVQVY